VVRNSAVIIDSKIEVVEETVQKSVAMKEVLISEVVTKAVHAVVATALLLIRIVLDHEEGMVDQEAKIEIVRMANQAENAIRSTKLSCILGI